MLLIGYNNFSKTPPEVIGEWDLVNQPVEGVCIEFTKDGSLLFFSKWRDFEKIKM